MDPDQKERLIDEFRTCLDGWDVGDDSPAGQASDPPVDLALLFAELSVLRNEVRVEARQFKGALDDMRAMTELLGEQNRRLSHDLDRARETAGLAQRQTERRLLLDMLEIRDRIAAAVDVVDAYRPGFLSRLAPAETRLVRSLREGIGLTQRRLDDVLVERRVRAIDAVGGRLDPNKMRVVGVVVDDQRVADEVLSEPRRGYMRDDELLRLADVIVNKREIAA